MCSSFLWRPCGRGYFFRFCGLGADLQHAYTPRAINDTTGRQASAAFAAVACDREESRVDAGCPQQCCCYPTLANNNRLRLHTVVHPRTAGCPSTMAAGTLRAVEWEVCGRVRGGGIFGRVGLGRVEMGGAIARGSLPASRAPS